MNKKLYRNPNDQMISGVCSGIADYIDADVSIIRIIFALFALFSVGTGVIAYFLAAIIIPERPY